MPSNRTRKPTYISIFSGIEAASVAWEPLGFEPLAFAEIDPFPSAVLKERYPHIPNLGDITKVNWSDYRGKVDIIVGGSPCQSFSIAGKREGLSGESGLMFEYIRCVRELMPRWFIWENVPGCLSSERGNAFRQLLSEMDELGYGLAWRVLDAQFFGVAQRRRRVFLVGSLGDAERAAEILFERDSLFWNSSSSRKKRQELALSAKDRSRGSYTVLVRCGKEGGGKGALVQDDVSATLSCANTQTLFQPSNSSVICMASGQANAEVESDMTPAQTARQYKDPQIVCMADDNAKAAIDFDLCGSLKVGGSAPIATDPYIVRRLTPRECERLQGFPDDWTKISYRGKSAEDCPDTPRYKALGNSMAVPVMKWIGTRILDVIHCPSPNRVKGGKHD